MARAPRPRSLLVVAALVGTPGLVALACGVPGAPLRANAPLAAPAPRGAGAALASSAGPAGRSEPPATFEPPARPRSQWPGAQANVDPADDSIVGPPEPLADCAGALAAAGVTFRPASLPVRTTKGGLVCGAPEVVAYVRGPGKIAYSPQPMLTCGMALALATFERIVQESANEVFGSSVTKIAQMGTYSCREVAAFRGLVSEHSYANAIDLQRFTLANGKTIDVLRDFERAEPPSTPAGRFLRAVSRRANDEDVFSVVLTPFFNAAHANHFHVDLARYRRDGTRPSM